MNEAFRRRLIGLAVLLSVAFLLSLLLPGAPVPEEAEPSTTVSLSGETLQVTEADAVPPPDDYTAPESAANQDAPSSGDETAISDLSGDQDDMPSEQLPEHPPKPSVEVAKPAATPGPPVTKPAVPAAKPAAPPALPKAKPTPPPASAAKPAVADKSKAAATWFVQIGSFAEAGTATTIVGLIGKKGHHGQISKIVGANGKTLHRVRAGPYPTEAAARSAQARLATQGYPQTRVLSEASH